MIEDENQEVVLVANLTTNISEFHHRSDGSECQLYVVKIAAVNGVGRGNYSQPVVYSLGCKPLHKHTDIQKGLRIKDGHFVIKRGFPFFLSGEIIVVSSQQEVVATLLCLQQTGHQLSQAL